MAHFDHIRSLVQNNDLEGLESVRQNGELTDKLQRVVVYTAIRDIKYDVLEWAHQHDFPKRVSDISIAINMRNQVLFLYLVELGYPLCTKHYDLAARKKCKAVLELLKQHNCPTDYFCRTNDTCMIVVKWGAEDVLEWIFDNANPDRLRFVLAAVTYGKFNVLNWLKNRGKLDTTVTAAAASVNRQDMIDWAISNEVDWSSYTLKVANDMSNYELLKYCRLNGCPWGPLQLERITDEDTKQWCIENGYPA